MFLKSWIKADISRSASVLIYGCEQIREHAEQTVWLKLLTDEASENRQKKSGAENNSRSVCMRGGAAVALMWTFEHMTVTAPANKSNSPGNEEDKALLSFLKKLVLLQS